MPFQTTIPEDNYSNRVADAIYLYAEQEAQAIISNPLKGIEDPENLRLKYQVYSSIYDHFKKKPNDVEQLSLDYVKRELAIIQSKLTPTFLGRLWNAQPILFIRDYFDPIGKAYVVHSTAIRTIHTERIQAHNLQALQTSLKSAGFTSELEGSLRRMIAQDLPAFQLRYSDVKNKNADFMLHFSKIPGTDQYYFSRFEASSRPTIQALLKNDSTIIKQSFSMTADTTFTATEAANLVNGKYVFKQNPHRDEYVYLNKTQDRDKVPFLSFTLDLDKLLLALPIKDYEKNKKSIITTLKSGSSKDVDLIINGQPEKYKIEISHRNIQITNQYNQTVSLSQITKSLTGSTIEKLAQKKISSQHQNTETPTNSVRI